MEIPGRGRWTWADPPQGVWLDRRIDGGDWTCGKGHIVFPTLPVGQQAEPLTLDKRAGRVKGSVFGGAGEGPEDAAGLERGPADPRDAACLGACWAALPWIDWVRQFRGADMVRA